MAQPTRKDHNIIGMRIPSSIKLALRLTSAVAVMALSAAHADQIDELIKLLNDDAYKVRVDATNTLIQLKPDVKRLIDIANTTKNPEVRHRLKVIIGMDNGQWTKLKDVDFTKLTACGNDTRNQMIFLARAEAKGSTVIGKYLRVWQGANFPVGDKEVMINDCQIWTGGGTWIAWKKNPTELIPMGITRDHKQVYAARAKFKGGLHPGTLIEGETKARIPWGEKVELLEDFEVLTREVK